MEPAARPFRGPYSPDETVNYNGVAYQNKEMRHSELSNALETVLHRPGMDWVDWGHIAPHQASSHGYPLHPPEVIASVSTLTHEALCEPDADAARGFQEPSGPGLHCPGADHAEPTPVPFRATAQDSIFGSYPGNQNPMISWHADLTYHPSYDLSPTSRLHPVPQSYGQISDFINPRVGELSAPWTVEAPFHNTPKFSAPEPHHPGESPIERFQEADQGRDLPLFSASPSHTVRSSSTTMTTSAISPPLNDENHVHKHMRRGVGGGATCAWVHGDGECGYSSHVDLVKRHIKRVHYRLK